MYASGQGVEVNCEIAAVLYEEAHEAGLAAATCNLEYMYRNGLGVEQSIEKAAEFYNQVSCAETMGSSSSLEIDHKTVSDVISHMSVSEVLPTVVPKFLLHTHFANVKLGGA